MTKITTEIYLERARKIHGDTYDYSKTVYKSALEKITITCKIHGDFTLRTRNHVDNKQGCKKCSRLISAAKTTKNTEYFIEKAKGFMVTSLITLKVNTLNLKKNSL